MWQTICFCPPDMPEGERHRFLALYNRFGKSQSTEARGQELSSIDLGLSFLALLTPDEALTVLQERRDLIVSTQEWLTMQEAGQRESAGLMDLLMLDHIDTLLEAERAWLERSIRRLRVNAV